METVTDVVVASDLHTEPTSYNLLQRSEKCKILRDSKKQVVAAIHVQPLQSIVTDFHQTYDVAGHVFGYGFSLLVWKIGARVPDLQHHLACTRVVFQRSIGPRELVEPKAMPESISVGPVVDLSFASIQR
jgi:hypothetical protein